MKREMTVDPILMFPTVEKLIYDLAWKFCSKYPITFDDAKSQAYWGFMRACMKYQPDRGASFTTLCYLCVYRNLQNLIRDRASDPLIVTDTIEDAGMAPAAQSPCVEMLGDLPEDARTLVHLLLEAPSEMLHSVSTPNQLLQGAKRYLVAHAGFTKQRVRTAERDARVAFQTMWATA